MNRVPEFSVMLASEKHFKYVNDILSTIKESAKVRGTGIALRQPDYIRQKMIEGKAIIALKDNEFAGFCYIENWGHGKFVANSGLIVNPPFRGNGLAKIIKQATFNLSRKKFPAAKIFGLTTGLAVMKINSSLGYRPVTFSELTNDPAFWEGCKSCINFDILERTNRKNCLCTGMLYDPDWQLQNDADISIKRLATLKVYARWFRFKYHVLGGFKRKKDLMET